MKISRIFKTIFMSDFISGLSIAVRTIFKSKKTINYPFEKGKISPRFRGEHALRRSKWRGKMHCVQTLRSDMSSSSYNDRIRTKK